MAVKPGPPPFDPAQIQPILQGASDQKPYVGKPKPMPPTPKPTQRPAYGSSDGSGFDFAKWKAGQHRPRPTMILPGQGQGPMPVGTKPLPNPVVKDTRGGSGGLEDWIKSHPGGMNPDEDGGWVRKEYDPTKNANVNNPLWDGYRGGAPTADMGDNRLYRDPSTQPGNPEFRNFRGDMGMIRDGGQWGQRWQPGLSGVGDYAGVTTPGSWVDNGDPNAPQWRMHAMGGQMGDSGFGQDPNKSYPMPFDPKSAMRELGGRGLQQQGGYPSGGDMWEQDRWRRQRTNETGMTTGLWSPADQARSEGRFGPYDNPGGGMRAIGDDLKGLQGQAGFGGGMQGRGGPRDNTNYGWSIGATIGAKPHWNGPPGTEPSGNWGPGRPLPPGWDGGMKPGGMGQGGQQVQPGMGMPTQYGGQPSGRGGPGDVYDGMAGAVQRGPGAPGAPPVGTGPGSMGKPQQPQVGGRQPLRPGMEYRPGGGQRPTQGRPPVNPQQMQQGAQALYNDNTIPHEFKGQLMQAAQSGDPQAFNDMLFNSNIPHETKLRLQQMFGYGGGGGAPTQAATPDQGQNQFQEVINGVSQAYNGGKGSPYYGAF